MNFLYIREKIKLKISRYDFQIISKSELFRIIIFKFNSRNRKDKNNNISWGRRDLNFFYSLSIKSAVKTRSRDKTGSRKIDEDFFLPVVCYLWIWRFFYIDSTLNDITVIKSNRFRAKHLVLSSSEIFRRPFV